MLDFNNGDKCHSPFPQESKLYFRVAERELGWKNERTSEYTGITKQKALVRAYAGGGQWLANVGENYQLVENKDLFPYVEQHFIDNVQPELLHGVTVVEHESYNGRDCYREYRFPNIKCPSHKDVAYRAIVGNSYGGKAVSLLSGAIDFFCTNGMITGASEKQARKHTSGFTLAGVDQWISDSLSQFADHAKRIERYDNMHIDLTKEDALFEYLVDKKLLSDQRARQARSAMHQERNARAGRDTRPTLWHLYSALTDWASHADVRDTGNDHAANTRIQRTMHAERVINAVDKWVTA